MKPEIIYCRKCSRAHAPGHCGRVAPCVAQTVERAPCKRQVAGSSPAAGTDPKRETVEKALLDLNHEPNSKVYTAEEVADLIARAERKRVVKAAQMRRYRERKAGKT